MLNIIEVEVRKLHFDPENPRIPTTVNTNQEKDILDWMIKDATLVELMASIGTVGFFPAEPLLAMKKTKTTYYIIEGNRRLAAVKLLLNPDTATRRKKAVEKIVSEASYRPTKLPIIEFEDRLDILDYLGYRHITGIKEWDPLAKAKYLHQLYEIYLPAERRKIFNKLANLIGSNQPYVKKLLTGLSLYENIADEEFYNIDYLDEISLDFSIITTALNYKSIVSFLGLTNEYDPEITGLKDNHLREFITWSFEKDDNGFTKIGDSRNLRYLSKVVSNPYALTHFREGYPLRDAVLYTDEPDENFFRDISQSMEKLKQARDQVHLIKNPTETWIEILKNQRTIAGQLIASIEAVLDFDEDD